MPYQGGQIIQQQKRAKNRMRNILAIVERELRAYFNSPIAYVVLTIFVFLSGIFFRSILAQVMQIIT